MVTSLGASMEGKIVIYQEMATLTGILVDVSESMERNIGGPVDEEGGSWARSIFKVLDGLIKHDVTKKNHVFGLGVGARYEPQVFDMLNTIKKAQSESSANRQRRSLSKWGILNEILSILERNGAPRVRTWAKMNVLMSVVTDTEASMFLGKLLNGSDFRRRFVDECLPKECKELERSLRSYGKEGLFFMGGYFDGAQEYATKDAVQKAVDKGKKLAHELSLVGISPAAVMNVQKASEILHGSIGEEEELTKHRVDELMETVKPFIYGGTPLMRTMKESVSLFSKPEFKQHHKLLFILSDGEPGDGYNPPLRELSNYDVTIICCYITNKAIADPRRLYSVASECWEKPAKFMFKMSSTITTQMIPRTIFVKRGWNIDIENNETHLFFQVNHPDMIEDVCDLARNVVCCQDSLSDMLASVSLDLYINQVNQDFSAKGNKERACYANASAAVLHLAMKRIVGREGGYPDFFDLRKQMIDKNIEKGVNVLRVLEEMCLGYRLHCEKMDLLKALKAITAKRPVLVQFRLTDHEWDLFSDFYKKHPDGILTKSDLNITQRSYVAEVIGHAVVLTSYNGECLRMMNSWGSDWADGGFFRVRDADILGLEFIDVKWTQDDLKQSEIDAYKQQGPSLASKLMSSLKGLQTAMYKCPLCSKESKVVDYKGKLLRVVCPCCNGWFKTKEAGDDLALNMYLTSLSH
ncbi:unnamed protein product [Owenia fusiformis]|uniref:VWFA domain-containing protein n=1 Tax=Owenia fusiformis TaxID=6347 RepID=A0A8S4NPF0_OWEFU|nr:unnamed protein product [Owenia fusiformis]